MTADLLAPARRSRRLLAALVASVVYVAAVAIVRLPAFALHPDPLSAALALDLLVTVPAAYWWLVVRPGHARARTLLPAFAASVLGARLVLPVGHQGMLAYARLATAPFELALAAWAAAGVRRAMRTEPGLDAWEAIERAVERLLGARAVSRVAAAELATLYYACAGGARAAGDDDLAPGDAFPAALAWALAMVTMVEGAAMHVALVGRHPALAWTLTALALYTVVWIAGHWRASGRRASRLDEHALVLRAGLRLTARVPLSLVASAETLTWRTRPVRAPDLLDAARPGVATVLLTFREPVVVAGALGLRRRVRRVALPAAHPARFVARVREAARAR